jgi:hypothetical protein
MGDERNLISAGLRIVNRHKRYIFWFWLLNLTLAEFGTAAFRNQMHGVLDHSLFADRLLHGFDLAVLFELLTSPQTGSINGSTMPAMYFAILFFVATLLLMPGVLDAYSSEGRPSREEFFRTCGRNLWRFVRLLLLFVIIAGPIAGILFGIKGGLLKAADKSTNEMLPFYTNVISSVVIFLIMTAIRIWFDLAQVDVVVRDQRAVRRSVAAGFRYARRHLFRLLVTYAVIAAVGLLVLGIGLWSWYTLVRSSSVVGAFLISQAMLILWLWARFWQRAAAVAYYLRETTVVEPVVAPEPIPVAPPAPLAPPVPEGTAPA